MANFLSGVSASAAACLELTGCDKKETFRLLKEVAEVEAEIRQNYEVFQATNPEKLRVALGPFVSNPAKFRFVLGERLRLQELIDNSKKDKFKKLGGGQGAASPSYACNRQINATIEKMGNNRTPGAPLRMQGNMGTPETPNLSRIKVDEEDEIANILEKAQKVEQNINRWAKMQPQPSIGLNLNEHYSLDVTANRVTIKCLLCMKQFMISKCKGVFIISNYTKHLKKSCKGYKMNQWEQALPEELEMPVATVITLEPQIENTNESIQEIHEVEDDDEEENGNE